MKKTIDNDNYPLVVGLTEWSVSIIPFLTDISTSKNFIVKLNHSAINFIIA